MKKKFALGIAVVAALCAGGGALAAGLYGDFPGVGFPSYCSSTASGANGSPTCVQTVPAGPSVFAGTEYTNFDAGPLGGTSGGSQPQSYAISLGQLGQGAALDNTSPGVTNTIPNNTPFYYVDGAQAAAFAVTMPASAVEGQFQNIVCESSTAGVMTVAANAGQTLKGNPGVACAAVTGYRWRYTAANATWYRIN